MRRLNTLAADAIWLSVTKISLPSNTLILLDILASETAELLAMLGQDQSSA